MMIPIYHSAVPASSSFQHKPLDGPRQFRLLKLYPTHFALRKDAPWLIEHEIVHFSLDSPPPYETVSYVWGSESRTQMIRLLPGNKTLAVTEAVTQLLSHLKKSSLTGYLWIDQLCINQDDELERNHQVTLMGETYSRAKRTLAWLGETDADANLVLGTVKVLGPGPTSFAFRRSRAEAHAQGKKDVAGMQMHLESKFSSSCSVHSTVRGAGSDIMDMDTEESEDEGCCHQCVEEAAVIRANAASRLLNRPWFTRCWIVQEVLLAKEVYLMIGDTRISLSDFHRAIHANLQAPKLDGISSKMNHGVGDKSGLQALRFLTYFWDSLENSEIPMFSCILDDLRDGAASGTFKAADPRDVIYAFLGMHQNAKALISPHYSWPVEHVYADAALAVIQETGDLSMLGICDALYQQSLSPGLPSWVPDWSRASWPSTLFGPGRGNDFAACGSFKHASQPRTGSPHLLVMGTPIDRIAAIHPQEYPRDQPGYAVQGTQGGERRDSQTPDYLELGRAAEELTAARQPHLSKVTIGRVLNLLHATDQRFPDGYQYSWRERDSILRYAAGRQIAQGSGEPLALVPAPSVVGDEIWLLRGCPAPVVLRKAMGTSDGYGLVGACYVEGVMRGEQAQRLEAACTIQLT